MKIQLFNKKGKLFIISLLISALSYGQSTFNSFKDQSVCAGTTLNYAVKTSAAAVIQFSKADKNYIELNSLAADLAGVNRSIFMWLKSPVNVASKRQNLFSINTVSGGNVCNLLIGLDEYLYIYDGSNFKNSNIDLADDAWHYVGYTYNDTTNDTKIYVDGVLVSEYTNEQTMAADAQVSLGQEFDNSSTSDFFDGQMTEISVWNTVLDASDIATAMQSKILASHNKYANLVGYYNGFGTTGQDTAILEDKSGKGNIGNVMAFTLDYSLTADIPNYNALDWYTSQEWYQNGSLQTTAATFSAAATTDTFELKVSRDNIVASNTWSTTIVANAETIDEQMDQNICSNKQLSYNPTTHKVAPFTFSKTDERFVNINALQDDLAASHRSIFMWVKSAVAVAGEKQILFAINSNIGQDVSLLQIGTDEHLELYDGNSTHDSGFDLGDDAWHFVGYTYNNYTNIAKVYVDGLLVDTVTNDQDAAATNKYSLGQEFDAGLNKGNFYDGIMTEVSVWNTVLETNEITTIMNAKIENTNAAYANLVGYYSFPDHGDNGTVLKDWSVKKNDGKISGTITSATAYLQNDKFNSTSWFTKQWSKNNADTSTENSYNVWPFLGSDDYKVVLERPFLELTDTWSINYNESIVEEPQDVSVHEGTDAQFSVNAVSGSTHQWYQVFDKEEYAFKSDGLSTAGIDTDKAVKLIKNGNDIFLLTDLGLSVSEDNGVTWTRNVINGVNATSYMEFHVIDDTVVLFKTGFYKYYISYDKGKTFAEKRMFKTDQLNSLRLYSLVMANSTEFYFLTEGNLDDSFGVHKSVNSGASFSLVKEVVNNNFSPHLFDVYFGNQGGFVVTDDKIIVGVGGNSPETNLYSIDKVTNNLDSYNFTGYISSMISHNNRVFIANSSLWEVNLSNSNFVELADFNQVRYNLKIAGNILYAFSVFNGTTHLNIAFYDLAQDLLLNVVLKPGEPIFVDYEFDGDKLYGVNFKDTQPAFFTQKLSELLPGETNESLTLNTVTASDNENKYLVEITKESCVTASNVAKLFVKTGDIVKPILESTTPADEATGVAVQDGMTFTLDFNENIQKGTGTILIRNKTDKSYVATIEVISAEVSITNDIATITPTASQVAAINAVLNAGNTDFYLEVPKEAFTDTNGNTFAGILETQWDYASNAVITINWTGTTNTDWATATNWNTSTVPTATDNVVIPNVTNKPIIATSTTAISKDVTIETSGSLTLATGAAITVNGNFSSVETNALVLNSGSTIIVTGTATGAILYKRNLPSPNWYLIASPVKGETVKDFLTAHTFLGGSGTTPSKNIAFANYTNNGSNWNYYVDGDFDGLNDDDTEELMTEGEGYLIKLATPNDISFSGTINTSSVTSQVITQATSNFNLIGNPFTAYVNLGDFFADNGSPSVLSEPTGWFWDGSAYQTKTANIDAAFEVTPVQAFFVSAGAASVQTTFDYSKVSHQTTDVFQKSSDTRPQIKLFMSDGKNTRYTRLFYLDNTTTGFDNGYDGTIFGGESQSFTLYTHLVANSQGQKLGVQALPPNNYENMVIPIGVNTLNVDEISFTTETLNLPSGINVFIEDKQAKTFTQIDQTNSKYTIKLTQDLNDIGRFYLHTSSSVLNVTSNNLENVSMYTSDKATLRIVGLTEGKTQVKLFSVLGKQVMSTSFQSNGVKDISITNLAAGIYIVELQTQKGTLNKKIILE